MVQKRLLETAIGQFGRYGFDGASTRDIARASDTAMSSITYHFGGKRGLYLACADHIAAKIREREAGLLASPGDIARFSREDAMEHVLTIADSFGQMMLHPDSANWTSFMVREQQEPTEAFERLYNGCMRDMIDLIDALLTRIRPELSRRERRALTLIAFGQALVLRASRAAVCRALDVAELGEEENALLRSRLRQSTLAILTGGTA